MILQRIKNAIKGFKEPQGFEWSGFIQPQNDPEGTVYKTIATLNIGDGTAEFLGEGTQEEFEKQEKEDKGFKGIFGL